MRLLRDAYVGTELLNRLVTRIEILEGGLASSEYGGDTGGDRNAAVKLADDVYTRFDRARVGLAAGLGIAEPKTWEA